MVPGLRRSRHRRAYIKKSGTERDLSSQTRRTRSIAYNSASQMSIQSGFRILRNRGWSISQKGTPASSSVPQNPIALRAGDKGVLLVETAKKSRLFRKLLRNSRISRCSREGLESRGRYSGQRPGPRQMAGTASASAATPRWAQTQNLQTPTYSQSKGATKPGRAGMNRGSLKGGMPDSGSGAKTTEA